MNILTLTTDSGEKDHYVASLKGFLLSNVNNITIVDISHQISPFNVSEAARQVRNCIGSFPSGTIHVVGVDDEPRLAPTQDDSCFPAIMKYRDQYFVSIDNGFFGSLLEEESPQEFYVLPDFVKAEEISSFSMKTVLLPIAIKLIKERSIKSFAKPIKRYKKAFSESVFMGENGMLGQVIHIDVYGNLITNITKEMFDRYKEFDKFTLFFNAKQYHIESFSTSYNTVPPGEKLALFNSNGYLEIAINRAAAKLQGGAEQLFGAKRRDKIKIEFSSRGSHETIDSLFD